MRTTQCRATHAIMAFSILNIVLAITGCGMLTKKIENPPQVVDYVDLERYAGTWYEIARFPAPFQKNCVAVTATYTLRDDGKIDVVNRCRKHSLDGPRKSTDAVAWVADESTNAKLKVRFFWPFTSDYWIIGLDDDYHYAIVSNPRRTYLWILNRTTHMDDSLYQSLVQNLHTRGFDTTRLIKTPQIPQRRSDAASTKQKPRDPR